MIARVIHDGSPRREKSFLSLNCGAIPPTLLEAELFGYVGGAFTGALEKGKTGLIEAAHEGTLFLDEIDAFPLEAQVKLLTFLDTKGFIAVGDRRVRQVDVRLVVATNKDLRALVDEGKFREDLWFRLNIVPLRMPSLTERREDLPQLVQQFVGRLNDRHGSSRRLDSEAVNLLGRYAFPGNVRELENILERAFVLSAGSDVIAAQHLPEEVLNQTVPVRHVADTPLTLQAALAEVEYHYLKKSCARHHRQVDIAADLGVSQPTVQRLLKRHGLTPSSIHL
ncbi:sigma 54-interacting transcriptional regulator [Sneathiella glossodoripedis]|uniref:sigma 54-interacting transcriptional regulator n=1 Tax=Sneathiella glossodoripedis TaxID=418853 RepID=UPI00068408FC|nr:sigma 54-interacting transcriptional regulator [Sneathiella glossodoripedis]